MRHLFVPRGHGIYTPFTALAKVGVSFGSCLAIVISYTAWNSIPWAILHGILGWGYVIYYAIRHLG